MNVELVNPEDKGSWKHTYIVKIGTIGTIGFLVHADDESQAIDTVADFCDEAGYKGFFAQYTEPQLISAYWDENHPEHAYMRDYYFPAGNANMLITSEMTIKQLR